MHAFSRDECSKLLDVFRSFRKGGDKGHSPNRDSVEKKLMKGKGDFNDLEQHLLKNALALEMELCVQVRDVLERRVLRTMF